jgi:hypothetical protein
MERAAAQDPLVCRGLWAQRRTSPAHAAPPVLQVILTCLVFFVAVGSHEYVHHPPLFEYR